MSGLFAVEGCPPGRGEGAATGGAFVVAVGSALDWDVAPPDHLVCGAVEVVVVVRWSIPLIDMAGSPRGEEGGRRASGWIQQRVSAPADSRCPRWRTVAGPATYADAPGRRDRGREERGGIQESPRSSLRPERFPMVGTFRGRPRGRIVRSRPSRTARLSTQVGEPKGRPVEQERRMAASSSSEGD